MDSCIANDAHTMPSPKQCQWQKNNRSCTVPASDHLRDPSQLLRCILNPESIDAHSVHNTFTTVPARSNVSFALVFATVNALNTDILVALVQHPCRYPTQCYLDSC